MRGAYAAIARKRVTAESPPLISPPRGQLSPKGKPFRSNFVVRPPRVAPQYLAVALVGGVAKLPHIVLPLPDVGAAEAVRQVHKVVAVHPGLLKQLAGPGEVLAVQRQIFENFLFKTVRVLAVKLLAERLALVQRDLLVADLLRSVVGRAANAVLNVGRVVEEIVDLVIDGVVLGVGAWVRSGAGRKPPCSTL